MAEWVDSDAVQFELVNSIDELTSRTRVAGEKDGSTLQIDAAGDRDQPLCSISTMSS